jgi:uncharacterized caspase-like protein
VWAWIGDRPQQVVPITLSHTEEAEVNEVTLWLPPQSVVVALEVRTSGLVARSAAVRLHWSGTAPEPRPTLFVLAIGVSEYKYHKPDLHYADRDAKDLVTLLCTQEGVMYEKVEARMLRNQEATVDGILRELQWLTDQTESNDIAVVFLSGHGLSDREGCYHFLPYDFESSHFRATTVSRRALQEFLTQTKARKRVLLVDSCHAGASTDERTVLPDTRLDIELHVNLDQLANELARASGVIVLTASTGNQDSIEDISWQNGAFTEALLEGLAGKADFYERDDVITIDELNLYIPVRVNQLTCGRQTPMRSLGGTNFAIACVPPVSGSGNGPGRS